MRLIAFVTKGTQIRKNLDYFGIDSEPLPLSLRHAGHLLWDDGSDANEGESCRGRAGLGPAAQPTSDYEADQRQWVTG